MNPNPEFKARLYGQFKNLLAVQVGVLLLCLAALVLAVPARAETSSALIPISEIGAKATADYHGDALGVTATADGARLRCGFQKLDGHATSQGLWLESTEPGGAGKLRLVATSLRRGDNSTVDSGSSIKLPSTGTVTINDKLVEFTRPGVIEEYSVSVDGLRQDFVITTRPAGTGDLRVELLLSGARAESARYGVTLRLEGTRRQLAYNRLRAQDAAGRDLKARLEVLSTDRLVVTVTDAGAKYPIRIDPTFSDADWVSLNPGVPGTDAEVLAVVADGSGNIYIGGEFTIVATVPANCVAKWDGSSWSALGSGMGAPYANDSWPAVRALAVSGTNLYVGGHFTTAGEVPAYDIAKWDGSAWSALGTGVDNDVYVLAAIETNVYVEGVFTNAGAVVVNGFAKWDGSIWSAFGTGFNIGGPLAVSGTNLYAVVWLANVYGLAKWDGNTWSFSDGGVSGLTASGYRTGIYALTVSATNVYVGGVFTNAGGVSANCVAKWDGSKWSALGTGIKDQVSALSVSGTNLYAAGNFTNAGGVAVQGLAKWNGSTWSPAGTGTDLRGVFALAANGNDLYAGGNFWIEGGGGAGDCIVKWNGTKLSGWGSGIDGPVFAFAVNGTDLYAGGEFQWLGGVSAGGIAKWDGSTWSGLGPPDTERSISAIAIIGNDIYIGGGWNLYPAGGAGQYQSIAKWNGKTWEALGPGLNGGVSALAVSGTNLYVGGNFSKAGTLILNCIGKWDGHAWSPLGLGMPAGYGYSEVKALAVDGTNLYAGGTFGLAGGVNVGSIARWDGSSWSALGSGMDSWVYSLTLNGTNLYAGGGFSTAGGVTVNQIAKWDGRAWSPLGSGLSGFKWPLVRALASDGTNLYVGGHFTAAGGVPAKFIARWDGNSWAPLGSGMSGVQDDINMVAALVADGAGHLFVGGSFTLAGSTVSPHVAVANLPSSPAIVLPPQSQTVEIGSTVNLTLESSGYPAGTYLWFFNETNLVACGTNCEWELPNCDFSQSGSYTIVVTNVFGAVTSAPVTLNVIPPVKRKPVPAINLTGEVGSSLKVEYTGSLIPAQNWLPLDTVNLTNPPQYWFDLTKPLPTQRFYRAWQTGTSSIAPSLSLPGMVPAITLNGNIGDKLRLDCINQIGPTDAWVTLDTVTLTNTSQLYFDTSAVGQPARLYRIVPAP